MDVPHPIFNHEVQQMYSIPTGIPMPSVAVPGVRTSEGEVGPSRIVHQSDVIADPHQGYTRENIPAGMPIRMPWMEQHLAGKLPPLPLPVPDRNDKQQHTAIQDNNDKRVWADVKPRTVERKKREEKPDSSPEPEVMDEEVVSNFVPLTWSRGLKAQTVSKPEKDVEEREANAEKEREEAALIQQSFTIQPVGYTCVQCGHVVHHNQLAKHIRMHTADRPFKCEVCKRAFRQKSNLIVHMRMHTGELPFPCEICGKAFRQKSILVTHVRTHTREMPYKCTMCPKAFTQKSNLVEHVRVHTGEKPYICPECNKAFAQKSNLVVHIRSHTGEAPFTCGVCGKSFRQKSILTTHMRTHTGELPFKCQTCERGFAQKSNLVEHSRQHTGEKPYICQECDKAFIRHQDLLQHMRHHTGRKPYDCPICGKMFVRKKHMEKHYQSHIKHRFNCRVCGLGFMDENLMVIHLTTHCHCHICDIKFNTKDELTEHCRRHAMGIVPGGSMSAVGSNMAAGGSMSASGSMSAGSSMSASGSMSAGSSMSASGTMTTNTEAHQAAVTIVKHAQTQMAAAHNQGVHPHDRINDREGSNKSFKNIPPDAYRVPAIPTTQQMSEAVSHSGEYVPASST